MRRMRWIVVGSMTVLFVLATVLVFQIAIRMNSNSQVAALTAEQERLQILLQDTNREIDYFQTWQFIEDWAREHLGWGRPGQAIFVRP